jgi:hypothetical protein
LVEPSQPYLEPIRPAPTPLAGSESLDELFAAVEAPPAEPSSKTGQPNLPTNSFDFSRPINETPYATPQYGGMPNINYPTGSSPDGFWVTGVVLGSISLMLACGCGCYGSIPGIVLSSIGIILTFASKSPNKVVGFLLNGLGLGFSMFFLMILLIFGVISAMN